MRKKFTCLFLSMFLGICLIGCGGSSNSSTVSKDNKANTSHTESASTKPVELTISAAASLKEAMADIEPLFKEEAPNVTLIFNFGSSGSLQQQIEQGAPSDVFISAGKSQMTALADKSLLLDDTNKDLIKNSLVLIGPSDTTLTSIDDLKTDAVQKIAVGEPSSVPAGKYADETLTKAGLKDEISSKLVFAKDVKEVLAWTTSGNAEAGFVYLSDAISSDSAKIIETISEDLHSPITYPVAVIKATKNETEAKAFEDFLFTEDCQKVFEKYGYTIIK